MRYRHSVLQNGVDQIWSPPSLLFNGHRGILAGVKWAGREVDHLQKSSAVFKNEWRYISTPPISLDDVDRDNITFSFYSFTGLSDYKVYVYIVKHNYILGGMLFTIRKAQLHVSALNVGHLQVVQR